MFIRDPMGSSISKRVLDPIDRIVEVLCGLIIVLTFTLTADVSRRENVQAMLIATFGCSVAWGIVDGVMYLMTSLSDRRTGVRACRLACKTADPAEAQGILSDVIPPTIASVLKPPDLDLIWHRLKQLPDPPEPALTRDDWLGAAGVALLVFLSTVPVVIPFAVLRDAAVARRISNFVALAMLFIAGFSYGRCVGYRPIALGLSMALFGTILVAITVALGG